MDRHPPNQFCACDRCEAAREAEADRAFDAPEPDFGHCHECGAPLMEEENYTCDSCDEEMGLEFMP